MLCWMDSVVMFSLTSREARILSKNCFSWTRHCYFKTTTTDPASKSIWLFRLRLSINIIQYSATRYLAEKDKHFYIHFPKENQTAFLPILVRTVVYVQGTTVLRMWLSFSHALSNSYPKTVPTHPVLRQTHSAVISPIYRLTFLIKLIFIYLISTANFPFAENIKDLYINQSCISEFVIRRILKYAEMLFTSQTWP